MFIFNLHCQLVLRVSGNILHKNTSQCKILIVPEDGWFGQPKYSTPLKIHSTLYRSLPSYCFVFQTEISGKYMVLICRPLLDLLRAQVTNTYSKMADSTDSDLEKVSSI